MITDEEVYLYLEHHGVKGMRWGVRKKRESSSDDSPKMSTTKKLAIGGGIIVAAAALTAGAIYAKKRFSVPVSKIEGSNAAKGANFVKDKLEEPAGIVHATRGKTKGFRFQQGGGLKDPFSAWEKAGGTASGSGPDFVRHGKDNSLIYARFMDPEGRKDQSGRLIPHEVIIPRSLSKGISNIDDVVKKIWPMIKDGYDYT